MMPNHKACAENGHVTAVLQSTAHVSTLIASPKKKSKHVALGNDACPNAFLSMSHTVDGISDAWIHVMR